MPGSAAMTSPGPDLAALERGIADAMNKALRECGMVAQREAVKNAPRSAKASEIRRMQRERQSKMNYGLGPTKRQKAAWKARRNPRATARPKPGGLERSIKMECRQERDWERSAASIFVPTGSEAGKYARRMHDEKGKTWRKRGPGTVAKGARADEKFIERAIGDNAEKFREKFARALDRTLKQFGG